MNLIESFNPATSDMISTFYVRKQAQKLSNVPKTAGELIGMLSGASISRATQRF